MALWRTITDILFPPREDERLVRDTTSLPRTPIQIQGVSVLLSYKTQVKAAIREAKFHANERAFSLLADVLREYLKIRQVIVVPVPLSIKRRRERGYNQVEEVCERACATLPHCTLATNVLTRTIHTAPQTSRTGKERREALKGAFTATVTDPDTTYLIVDDVLTTGATMEAAVTALQASGAKHIEALALAH